MRGFFRHLVDNLGSMILALLLAFAVWIAATLQADPFVGEVFANIPVALLNQPEDTVLLEPISEQANVEVRAPDSVLRDLTPADFEATMDLGGVESGTPVAVTVQVTCTNEAVRIQAVDPSQQTIHLEPVDTITLSVALDIEGEVAIGHLANRPRITPAEVTVHGPVPYLNEVVSVTGSLNIQGAKEDVTEQVVVTPRDAEGRLVPGVQWTPDRVEVYVQVRSRVGFKPDVEVVPDLQVIPAPGYRLGSVSVEPSVVTLKGPPAILNDLPGFVKTWPISSTGATEDLVQLSFLTVPTDVMVVDVDYVTVTIEVLPIQSSRTMTGVVDIQGVPPEWLATASPTVVDVILEGPDAVLSELQPGDIQISLNLFGYPLGVHRVEPIVLAPEDVAVVSVIPETIEVVIEKPLVPTVPTNTLDFPLPEG